MSTQVAPPATFRDWFGGLGQTDRVRFLLAVAHELTVATRSYYVPETDELTDGWAVRALNEIQHRVTAHAAAILDGRGSAEDAVAYGWLDAVPDRGELRGWVNTAVNRAVRLTTAPTV